MPPKSIKEKKVKKDNIKLEKIIDKKNDTKKDTIKNTKNDTKKDNENKISVNKEWIEHTKLFAKNNNMKYTEAIKSDENRIAYHGKKMIANIDNKKVKK